MPAQAVDAAACPAGYGSGRYTLQQDVKSIVAVVGTAHVYGILKRLEQKMKNR